MSALPKDKRTKDQLLRLLDDALVQEEKLIEQISLMRTQLADCRKRADDPRAELAEDAIPSSKVPFRLDFYRATGDGPLKGIIEHLPSRQMRTFEGEGQAMVAEFVAQFILEEKVKNKKPLPAPETVASVGKTLPGRAEAPTIAARSPGKTIAEMTADRRTSRLLLRLQEEFLHQFPDLQEQSN